MNNPLFPLAHPIRFDLIRPEHFGPAVEAALSEARSQLDELESGAVPPESFMRAFEALGRGAFDALAVIAHLESTVSSPELRSAYMEVQPSVTEFMSSVVLSPRLWEAVKSFAASEHAAGLSGAERKWTEDLVRRFRANGADLPPEKKDRVQQIDVRLAELGARFTQNTLDSTNAFKWWTSSAESLSGLPESELSQAAARAGGSGYEFGLKAHQYDTIMRHADDAALREHFYRAYWTRAGSGDHDNAPVMREMLELRLEKARALGYRNFADYVTEDRMAGSGDAARRFIADLAGLCLGPASRQFAELERFAGRRLQPWDIAYHFEKMRRQRVGLDEEALRPYLRFEDCLEGVFAVLGRLHGVSVEPAALPVWHPTVRSYRMTRGGREVGHFYLDPFSRDSKVGGAWMSAFFNRPPVGYVCTNFQQAADGPTLLLHDDLVTLFHEFGHLMHHMLSTVGIESMFGTNVAWDFVELPSQIMENWCFERECLDMFAKHWQTGEPIPGPLFDSLVEGRAFMGAYSMLRGLSFSEEDLALHIDWDPSSGADPVDVGRAVTRRFSFCEVPPEASHSRVFDHVFADAVGYASGYYSYRWAEVLDADAFERFQQEGVFNEETARQFRECILERGSSEDANKLFRDFRGAPPSPGALMARYGLVGQYSAGRGQQ